MFLLLFFFFRICIRLLNANQCFKNYSGILGYVDLENKIIVKKGYELYLVSFKMLHHIWDKRIFGVAP